MPQKKQVGKGKSVKLRPDVAETAFRVLQEAVGERPKTKPPAERTEKNHEAVKRGRKGGEKGGTSTAQKRTSEERAKGATVAALARWKKSEP
ncbi:MAG TPA: hypothetical protein VGM67_11180 [Gemmatimonadaceae bacterium]|jgi:hypothetical protein